MKSSDPLESSKRRIARAKKHIRDLKRSMKAFTDRKPYSPVVEPHSDGIHQVLKLKARRKRLPNSFSDIAADAAENLRASLDQAIFAIAMRIEPPLESLDEIYFPFSRSKLLFGDRVKRCCPRFPEAIIALLHTFEPYHRGNETLWTLNDMCRQSKHRHLIPMNFRIGAANVREMVGLGGFSFPPTWDSTKNEFVLGMMRPETHVRCNLKLSFNIGFEGHHPIGSQPAIGILNEMTRIVESIVMGLEAEATRIGLFDSWLHSK